MVCTKVFQRFKGLEQDTMPAMCLSSQCVVGDCNCKETNECVIIFRDPLYYYYYEQKYC